MAKQAKKQAKKRAAKKSQTDVRRHIIETALTLAATGGWRDLSLADIAEAARLPLSQVYPVFPSKGAILAGFERQLDAQVLAEEEAPDLEEARARDRLFDVLMRRFDALAPYKEGVAALLHDLTRQPLTAACAWPGLARSMALMLEAAGLSSDGLRGAARTKGLAVLYLATLRVWLRDDSPDLAKTMAALDGYLRRIEGLVEGLDRWRGRVPGGRAARPAA